MNAGAIWEKIKQYPVPVVCIMLCAALAGGWYTRRASVLELTVERDKLADERDLISRNMKEGDGLEADLARLREITETIEKRLMIHHNQALNKNNFHRLVNRYDAIQLISLQQGSLWDKKDESKPQITLYQPFEYRINLEGPYKDVTRLMEDLRSGGFYERAEGEEEDGKFFIRLESLVCSASGRQETFRLKVNITAHILGKE